MTEPSTLIHPTYRYLDRRIRLAGLALGHWAQLVGAAAVAWLLVQVLPLSSTTALSAAVTIAGVPLAISLAAGVEHRDPFDELRAVARWRRTRRVYPPTDTAPVEAGYVLDDDRRAAA